MLSLSVPTRKRVPSIDRLVNSINATTSEAERAEIELCFYVDDDDTESIAKITELSATMACQAVVGTPSPVRRTPQSFMHNSTFEACTGPYFMICADDIAFRTPGWYPLIMEAFNRYEDKIVQVYANDGFQGGDVPVATHGFYHRNWIKTVGYMYPSQYHVAYMDTWTTEVARLINRRVYFPDVLIEHLHPAAGKGQWDDNYTNKIENGGHGNERAMYESEEGRKQRQEDANKLQDFIDNYGK